MHQQDNASLTNQEQTHSLNSFQIFYFIDIQKYKLLFRLGQILNLAINH